VVKKYISFFVAIVMSGALMLPPAFAGELPELPAEEIQDPEMDAEQEMDLEDDKDPEEKPTVEEEEADTSEESETIEDEDGEAPDEEEISETGSPEKEEKPRLLRSSGSPTRLLGSSNTDAWLNDWDYTIDDLNYDGKFIYLKEYKGTETDISIGGKATVDGVDYPVCIEMKSTSTHYKTGLNRNKNLHQITFYSVDGTPVRPELNWRIKDLFYGMENLEGVIFGGDFKTDGVTEAISMFEGCKKLKYVDVEDLDLGKCTNLKQMFQGCESLNRITVNLNNASNTRDMFKNCKGLTEVTINGSGSNNGKLTYADSMFSGCTSLEEVNITGLDFSGVKDFSYMFSNCHGLKNIDMGMFNMSSATKLNNMFLYCDGLKEIDLTPIEWGSATPSATEMFFRTDNLEKVKVSSDFKPSYGSRMFYVAEYRGKLLTIEGALSQEFKDAVFPSLKDSNRFLGYVTLRSKIELEGQDLEDGMFGIKLDDDKEVIYGIYNSENGDTVDVLAKVYQPGSNTFTIKEMVEPSGGDNYVSCLYIDDVDEYDCEDSVRSKTVNIILNTDGSLSVEG